VGFPNGAFYLHQVHPLLARGHNIKLALHALSSTTKVDRLIDNFFAEASLRHGDKRGPHEVFYHGPHFIGQLSPLFITSVLKSFHFVLEVPHFVLEVPHFDMQGRHGSFQSCHYRISMNNVLA